MDWGDACDEIASNFHKIESALGNYMSKHGAVLKPELKDLLSRGIGIAGKNKFDITRSPEEVPHSANRAAEELYRSLDKAEEYLLNQVHSQSST